MLKGLECLFKDLTESEQISVTATNRSLNIRIIARWFDLQSPIERKAYILEGIEIAFPDVIRYYKIELDLISPSETN